MGEPHGCCKYSAVCVRFSGIDRLLLGAGRAPNTRKSAPADSDIGFTNFVQELYEYPQIVTLEAENVWLQVLMAKEFPKEFPIFAVRGVEPVEPSLDVWDRSSRG